jgi:hypothetical protein
MRLLHTSDFRIQEFSPNNVPTYAILSHTWGDEEVTFQHLEKQTYTQMKGYSKLQNCCKRAAGDGYSWVWIDTCCIDKTSSAELSEAINSMYSWYSNSTVCYAYLADTQALNDLDKAKWFTRGWTLQELIAPRRVILFDSLWRKLGSKSSLLDQLSSITGIPGTTISGKPPNSCNIAQRMSWASARQTTREEDIAYCLLGLFDVHMPPMYGEGSENAFLRLQEQILRQSSDQTLFLWTPSHEPYNLGLLASSPKAFCTHYDCFRWLPGLEAALGNLFDPYNTFEPMSFRPSTRSVDETFCVRNNYAEKNMHDFPASLGSCGLHISLLLNVGVPYSDVNIEDMSRRLICFDVMVSGLGNSSYICLVLGPDMEFGHAGGFIPDRLGAMRRVHCKDKGSEYTLNCRGFSFERTAITISQVRISTSEPGHPVTFTFHGQETRALVGETMLLRPGSSSNVLSGLTEHLNCSGGVVSIRHSCPKCDERGGHMLIFGVRGRSSDPWCCFHEKHAQKLSDQSNMDLYEEIELMNMRMGGYASHYMACGLTAIADIQHAADEGCYLMNISIVR